MFFAIKFDFAFLANVAVNDESYCRRPTLRASDEESRVRDNVGSLSRTIRRGHRGLALPPGAVRRSILVRRRPESVGKLVGRRRRRRSEHQRLRVRALGGCVRITETGSIRSIRGMFLKFSELYNYIVVFQYSCHLTEHTLPQREPFFLSLFCGMSFIHRFISRAIPKILEISVVRSLRDRITR